MTNNLFIFNDLLKQYKKEKHLWQMELLSNKQVVGVEYKHGDR